VQTLFSHAAVFSVALLFSTQSAVWNWLHRLGGPGLILLGLADNSAVPLPGSMDVFTIVLAAHNREWWFYYAAMATMGAVIGGYLTYRLAQKGGEEALEKKIGKQRMERVYGKFEQQGGFWVFLGAVLPPPFPIVPFLMAAAVLDYPRHKFLAFLAAGRGVRYFTIAYVAHIYGQSIIGWLSQYYEPLLYTAVAVAVLAAAGALIFFKWYLPRKKQRERKDIAAPARGPEHRVA
jgi:membrane protein YqaA with SNARE-associated domain